jgi:acetyl esterase
MDKEIMVSFKEKVLVTIVRLALNKVVARGSLRPLQVPTVDFKEAQIPTSVGPSRVLVYRPLQTSSAPLPVYVNLHGGGFIMAKAELDDLWCRVIAAKANCVVVNVDYRLAPEYKFPIALKETYDVIKWLYNNPHQLGIVPTHIAVGGHSAGGNIAAAICLLARERKEFPILTQILDYPPLDLATHPDQKPKPPTAIPPFLVKIFNTTYLRSEENARNPLISPVFADTLTDLPPALIIVAENDSLAQEEELYAQHLQAAGVKVILKKYKGASHAFTHNGPQEMAEDAWNVMSNHLYQTFYSIRS